MKLSSHIISIAAAAILLMPGCSASRETASDTANGDIVIIFYDTSIGNKPLKKAIKSYGSKTVYDYTMLKGMAVTVPEGKSVDDAIKYYLSVDGVVSAERDQKMELQH